MDVVYNVSNSSVITNVAQQLGFWSNTANAIVTTGNITGGGDYFLNHVGVVYVPTGSYTTVNGVSQPVMAALTGEWGRLRLNGNTAFLSTIPANSGITIYQYSSNLNSWTSDGVTKANNYIGTIALIA